MMARHGGSAGVPCLACLVHVDAAMPIVLFGESVTDQNCVCALEMAAMIDAIRDATNGRVAVVVTRNERTQDTPTQNQALVRVCEEMDKLTGNNHVSTQLVCNLIETNSATRMDEAVQEAAARWRVGTESILVVAPPRIATWAAVNTGCSAALLLVQPAHTNGTATITPTSDDDIGAPTSPLEVLQLFAARAAAQATVPCAVVKVAMELKRWRSLRRANMLPLVPQPLVTPQTPAQAGTVVFAPISFALAPLQAQLQATDAVLHKATDRHPCATNDDALTIATRDTYTIGARGDLPAACQRSLPRPVPLLDPWPNVQRVSFRSRMLMLTAKACAMATGCHAAVPDWSGPLTTPEQVVDACNQLGFPILLKADEACGTPRSHDMCAVSDASAVVDALLSVPLPCIAMRLVNHGEVFFKCYCIDARKDGEHDGGDDDDDLWCHASTLPSLPDAASLFRNAGRACVPFHALKSMPVAQAPPHNLPPPPADLLRTVAGHIARAFGLRWFGFDVISNPKGGVYVIDVNYLPSFGNAEGAPQALIAAVRAALL